MAWSALLALAIAWAGLFVWLVYRAIAPAPRIWRGEAWAVPTFGHMISTDARSYLAFLIWYAAAFGGLGLLGVSAALASMKSLQPLATTIAGIGFLFMIAAIPLILVHWGVSLFARPRWLIPPPYRDRPGTLAEGRERRRRRRAGLPPTDHTVELVEVPSEWTGDPTFLVGLCRECDWLEFADDKLMGPTEEDQLREKAARHTTVAPVRVNPLET